MYLLDTNVVSELRKVRSGKVDANVTRWAEQSEAALLFISVITVQEIELGILLAERKDPTQGSVFRTWLNDQVLPAFANRILPVDVAVALRSAALHAVAPRPVRDALIAATASVHGMTVVTRNVSDFAHSGVVVLNPWQAD